MFGEFFVCFVRELPGNSLTKHTKTGLGWVITKRL